MTFDMGIGSFLWRSFSEHFQEFFPYNWSYTTRDFDTQDMDELFPWLKSSEDGAEEKSINLSTTTPGEFVPILSIFAFLFFCIICNEGIA